MIGYPAGIEESTRRCGNPKTLGPGLKQKFRLRVRGSRESRSGTVGATRYFGKLSLFFEYHSRHFFNADSRVESSLNPMSVGF